MVTDAELIPIFDHVLPVDLDEGAVRRTEVMEGVGRALASDGRMASRHEDVLGIGAVTGLATDGLWRPWIASEHLLGFRNNVPMRPVRAECAAPE
jgi:hypothetical protein